MFRARRWETVVDPDVRRIEKTSKFPAVVDFSVNDDSVGPFIGLDGLFGETSFLTPGFKSVATLYPELSDALRHFSIETLGAIRSLDESSILLTPSEGSAIFCALMGTVNPGDRVLCFEPFRDSYRRAVLAAGGELVAIPLLPPDIHSGLGWRIDWSEVQSATSRPFRCFLLNTPHYPTGLRFDESDFDQILSRCRDKGAYLLSDEALEHLVYDDYEHCSVFHVAEWSRDTFVRVACAGDISRFRGTSISWLQGSHDLVSSARLALTASLGWDVSLSRSVFGCGLTEKLQAKVPHHYLSALRERKVILQRKRNELARILGDNGFYFGLLPAGGYSICVTPREGAREHQSDQDLANALLIHLGIKSEPLTNFCRPLDTALGARNHPLHRLKWLRFSFVAEDEAFKMLQERLSSTESFFELGM